MKKLKSPPMLALFALSVLSAKSTGFSRLLLSAGDQTTINLVDQVAFIIDAPSDSFNYTLTTAEHEVISHPRPFPSRHFMLRGESVVLGAMARPIQIPVWLLPSETCGTASAVLSSEHSLQLSSKSINRYEPICLFTQTEFGHAEVAVTVKTRDARTSVQFFGASGIEEPIRKCKLAEKCAIEGREPFFLRIQGSANVTLSVKLDYEIDHPSPSTVYCSVLSIPWIRLFVPGQRLSYGQVAQVLGNVKFTCRSQALDILGILGFIGLALLSAFVVVGCLHGWRLVNVGDWLFAYNEKQRFESLKKAPFANELGDAHIEGETT
jgi:hypothetical protein